MCSSFWVGNITYVHTVLPLMFFWRIAFQLDFLVCVCFFLSQWTNQKQSVPGHRTDLHWQWMFMRSFPLGFIFSTSRMEWLHRLHQSPQGIYRSGGTCSASNLSWCICPVFSSLSTSPGLWFGLAPSGLGWLVGQYVLGPTNTGVAFIMRKTHCNLLYSGAWGTYEKLEVS